MKACNNRSIIKPLRMHSNKKAFIFLLTTHKLLCELYLDPLECIKNFSILENEEGILKINPEGATKLFGCTCVQAVQYNAQQKAFHTV
ncbi:hypothetical protein NEIRO03_0843 [Nematocida sp. AWRm78]|nr:hypothetical protein NEIRO02_1109 [Nematocida sp. AWRm79]KAI5183228.1 hypothetical protein NEIRO03_0843 [Nematocida sp. AWRm78]